MEIMKPFGLMLVSIFLLSLLESPLPTHASSEEISFDNLCQKTLNVTFCNDIFRDPGIAETKDYKKLAAIVFDKAIENTQKNADFMMNMAIANSAKAYIYCVDGYETVVASFKDGRRELEKYMMKKANSHAAEARAGAEICSHELAKSGLEDEVFNYRSHEIRLYSDLCSAIITILTSQANDS